MTVTVVAAEPGSPSEATGATAEAAEEVAEEQTEQVETVAEAAVEIAQIEADRDVAIAESNNEAATEIAETIAEAGTTFEQEVRAWLEAHGDPTHPELRVEITELRNSLSSLSEIVEAMATPTLAAESQGVGEAVPANSEPTPEPAATAPSARRRFGRL